MWPLRHAPAPCFTGLCFSPDYHYFLWRQVEDGAPANQRHVDIVYPFIAINKITMD